MGGHDISATLISDKVVVNMALFNHVVIISSSYPVVVN